MLSFMGYPDRVNICRASEELDDWGMSVISNTKTETRCRLTESDEAIKLSGQKTTDYIAKYSICFPSTVNISPEDKIEIDGLLYDVAKISNSRDLSGNIMAVKVWV
ncbi:TPA: hypothetical protein KOX39_003409 [Clostridioides difficile]|nr:hypothetical protein [Clostridioides difficile]